TLIASWTLTALGRASTLAGALDSQQHIAQVRAGIAFAGGDPVGAAEICAEIGAATQQGFARLSAARAFVAQSRRAGATQQPEQALAFYRSVGATHYVREAESLLAASA